MTKRKRADSQTKRPSIWNGAPYGHYEGPRGNAEEWRKAFDERMGAKEAKHILSTVEETPWSILGIVANSTQDEIKTAYRQLIQKHHPDKGGTKEMAQKIIAAYTVLKSKVHED